MATPKLHWRQLPYPFPPASQHEVWRNYDNAGWVKLATVDGNTFEYSTPVIAAGHYANHAIIAIDALGGPATAYLGAGYSSFYRYLVLSADQQTLGQISGDMEVPVPGTVYYQRLYILAGGTYAPTPKWDYIIRRSSFDFAGDIFIQGTTALEQLRAPDMKTIGGDIYLANNALSLIDFPSLQASHGIQIQGNNSLTSLTFPSLVSMVGELNVYANTALTSLSFPAMTSVKSRHNPLFLDRFSVESCTNLTTVQLNSLVFYPDVSTFSIVTFQDCGLDQPSVDHILSRCVASPNLRGYVLLNGGTNSTPSASGLVDVYTLQARGLIVSTN